LIAIPEGLSASRAPGADPARTPGTGFAGFAVDVGTDRPIPGAQVIAVPGGAATTTDARGSYLLAVPPGTYTLRVERDGYVGVIRLNQTAASGYTRLDLQLAPVAPPPDQLRRIYARLVKQSTVPLVTSRLLASTARRLTAGSVPGTITVYYDQADPPYTIVVPLEDYVKGVVPNEVPWTWPAPTLQAQAVAARSYGVAAQLANGFVYPDARSQMYDPSQRTEPTNAAVDATAGQVMTYGGSVIWAFFFSTCNGVSTRNSEDALREVPQPSGTYGCELAGWNYVAYCRACPCGGHAPSPSSDCGYWGHGVGMCQWGAWARGTQSYPYDEILHDYYTGVTLTSPTPPSLQPTGPSLARAGAPISLTWTGDPSLPTQVVVYRGGEVIASALVAAGTFTFPIRALPVGRYLWTISQNSTTAPVSATLEVVATLHQMFLPVIGN
jgi:hypothetical protein